MLTRLFDFNDACYIDYKFSDFPVISMRFIFCVFLTLPAGLFAQTCDLLLKGGKIIDGTGNPWYYGDVAISSGKIVAIGNLADLQADSVIDVKGLIIAPGFIDVHTHIERNDLAVPTADN